ncbi:helix-turn-helix transcriptional regulator [Nocardioides sp. T2.26MG-1]|uniref:helix-turn-helix transcriptional regulator n=1 Tax=Nocardioides sp. T2.26MG-1 TaxID=3041166 RepID=UPI0025426174|nr:response regulator transcription factor [Nocardioides sp. T2.26MG-1]
MIAAGVERLLEPYANRVVVVDDSSADDDAIVLYDVFGLYVGKEEDFERVVKKHPDRVLAMSRVLQPGLTARALDLGAVASVSVGLEAPDLVAAIEAFAAGHLQDGSQADLDNQADRRRQLGRDVDLTPREQEVLGLIVRGRSNEELAAELYLSINTVKTLIRSIYRKIDVTSRAQAVAWGVEHGFPTGAESAGP